MFLAKIRVYFRKFPNSEPNTRMFVESKNLRYPISTINILKIQIGNLNEMAENCIIFFKFKKKHSINLKLES